MAACPSVEPGRWLDIFDDPMSAVAARFPRVEPRRRARAFVLGLLADLPRKHCWTIAEHAGMHRRARCSISCPGMLDADAVRDDLHGWVTGQLGDPRGGAGGG